MYFSPLILNNVTFIRVACKLFLNVSFTGILFALRVSQPNPTAYGGGGELNLEWQVIRTDVLLLFFSVYTNKCPDNVYKEAIAASFLIHYDSFFTDNRAALNKYSR
jgi:hypothetical protein